MILILYIYIYAHVFIIFLKHVCSLSAFPAMFLQKSYVHLFKVIKLIHFYIYYYKVRSKLKRGEEGGNSLNLCKTRKRETGYKGTAGGFWQY